MPEKRYFNAKWKGEKDVSTTPEPRKISYTANGRRGLVLVLDTGITDTRANSLVLEEAVREDLLKDANLTAPDRLNGRQITAHYNSADLVYITLNPQ